LKQHTYRQLCRLLNLQQSVHVDNRTHAIKQLYRKISLYQLTLKKVYDPYLQRTVSRIIRDSRIVLPVHEIQECIKWHHLQSKGDCARKLQYKIAEAYYGIGKRTIQQWINSQPQCSKRRPFFANKAPLRTIQARTVDSRHQIDLVDMSAAADKLNGTTYKYILSVLDVFSRHVWLRALADKSAETVLCATRRIYDEWNYPKIIQTDQGSEFKGDFSKFCSAKNIHLIHSRSHHPQSQGKDERSHQTWKRKIRFDMENGKDVHWAKNLSHYQSLYNHGFHSSIRMTPHECYFAHTTDVSHKARVASVKAANYMIKHSLSKHPPSEYNVGETVLVRLPRKPSQGVVRGGYSLRHTVCCEGKIVAVDRRRFQYKIQLNSTDVPSKCQWFSVTDITSSTRQIEHKRRLVHTRNKKNVKKTKCVCILSCALRCLVVGHS